MTRLILRYKAKTKDMKKVIFPILISVTTAISVLWIRDNYFADKSDSINQSNQIPVHFIANSTTVSAANVDFTRAAETSLNAVVHIKTKTEDTYNALAYDPFRNFFYGQPQQRIQQGSGSGVIIDKGGYIVTNNHVINGAGQIEVVLNDKRTFKAELVGADPQTDLALLKIKGDDLPFLVYGNSDGVKVGEWCLAVGNPFNLTSTVTAGIISAKGRNINILENDPRNGVFPIESFIQTDAAVNPGNSGGALVNLNGELIGINSAIASQNGAYIGYAFAIPVNLVKKVVADLVEFGSVQRAFIGVSIRDIDAGFANEKGLKSLKGAYVNGLTQDGAAESAGIKLGDIITKVEGYPVSNVAELQEQIGKFRPGDKVSVSVLRNEKELDLTMILRNKEGSVGVIKKEKPEQASIQSLGASFESISKEELSKLRLSNGVRISKLQQGKLASAGIREGFIITSVDKKKISSIQDMESTLESKTGGVLIEGMYPNGTRAYYGFGL